MMHNVKGLVLKRNNALSLQKREIQFYLNNADDDTKTFLYKLLPVGPHGVLPANPWVSKDDLLVAYYSSKPGSRRDYCVSFKDENNHKKYIAFSQISHDSFKKIGGEDYCSVKSNPYYPRLTQEAMSFALWQLWESNISIPVCFKDKQGIVTYKYVKARDILSLKFIKKLYADERDIYSLAKAEVAEERALIQEKKSKEDLDIKEEGKQVDLELKVKPEDSPMPGDDNF